MAITPNQKNRQQIELLISWVHVESSSITQLYSSEKYISKKKYAERVQ